MAIYLKQEVSEPVIEVTVKKTMEPKVDNFGKTKFSAIVIYEGQEMWADFAEKFVGIIKNGSTVIGIRKEYQGKPYYEWAVKNSVSEKKSDIQQEAQDIFAPKAQDTQDRILRSMALNNACALLAGSSYNSIVEVQKEILPLSKWIYVEMKNFINATE